MQMAVISIGAGNRPDPDVVDLFGVEFTVRRVTRSVQKALEKVDVELRKMGSDADSDLVVAQMAAGLDALLEPKGAGKKPALKVLTDAWKADDLSLDQLHQLYDSVQESAAKRPPTSAPAN